MTSTTGGDFMQSRYYYVAIMKINVNYIKLANQLITLHYIHYLGYKFVICFELNHI